jgi:uncharacterized damage-inducible protein DinB
MKLLDFLLDQLDREAAVSRRVLERVPEGRNDWKPHEKSMPMGYLASLVAMMPSWVAMAVHMNELDLNPPGGTSPRPQAASTSRELLQKHEEAIAKGRDALRSTNEEHLMTPWRLLTGGRVLFEQPRLTVIADTYTHLAHHRGQLTVYLRLNDVPVPSIYGQSADEGWS